MTYSFSRLNLYFKCPFKFYKRYIEKETEPVTEPLALGKAVHTAIELKMKGKTQEDALLEAYRDADIPINEEEYQKLVKAAPVFEGEGTTNDVEVEKYFKVPLYHGGPELQGYIDVVRNTFGMLSFVDWKTNRKKYHPLNNMQLPLYAWALSKLYNVETVHGTLFFLRYKRKPDMSQTFTRAEMNKGKDWAIKLADEIENKLFILDLDAEKGLELFPDTPSAECTYCPFALECYRKSLKEKNIS
ncbi:PD-(D/E)XK nuclease family protein [Cytobacillus sp. IB215665]|uniref:RecB family exonuclease n=1 Tax=Cytobacillus sp. IB215665 TaxID=3097357 RepID=UPI002A1376C3|nr:PD-(D/E)XK nuclease family protein [Cytobacillus sp. IB215665]MDX8367680.1 PD-(D/E)XK nuclease family protein [Cytobacillus sp. IB215665]